MKKIITTIIIILAYTQILNSMYYKIRRGDTAYGISRKYGIKLKELKVANPNINLSRLRVGQKIKLPISDIPNNISQETRINSLTLKRPIKNSYFKEKIARFSIFYIIRKGIIVSAAKGRVTFAGNINHLGNVIIIKHKDNYITTYKILNAKLYVKKGDNVKTGQIIAKGYGKTKLNFLFFKGNLPLNPQNFMR